MSDEERVKVYCMWCHSLVADVSKESLKTNNEFYCPECKQTIRLKQIVHNFGGTLTSLN